MTLVLQPSDIAVVVPVLNEAERLPALLHHLAGAGFGAVVVADGGSCDGSVKLAQTQHGVRLVQSARGRGVQMNTGAAAVGDQTGLLFLHADTRLPPGAAAHVAHSLSAASTVGGAFRLRFDRRHPLLDLYAACSRVDSGWTTFGDQALFMRRSAFEATGGFPDQPLLEDVEMRRRLKRLGRFVKLPLAVTTSARRFQAEGLLRRQLKNGLILLLHALRVSPERLARLYR